MDRKLMSKTMFSLTLLSEITRLRTPSLLTLLYRRELECCGRSTVCDRAGCWCALEYSINEIAKDVVNATTKPALLVVETTPTQTALPIVGYEIDMLTIKTAWSLAAPGDFVSSPIFVPHSVPKNIVVLPIGGGSTESEPKTDLTHPHGIVSPGPSLAPIPSDFETYLAAHPKFAPFSSHTWHDPSLRIPKKITSFTKIVKANWLCPSSSLTPKVSSIGT
ncbi:hypothetical protein V6N13_124889 [Hibiscus sabdariffa]